MEGANNSIFTIRKSIASGDFPTNVNIPGVVQLNVRVTVGGRPLPTTAPPVSILITGNQTQPHSCDCCPFGAGAFPASGSENESLRSSAGSPAHNISASPGSQTERSEVPSEDIINLDGGGSEWNDMIEEGAFQIGDPELDSKINLNVFEDPKLSYTENPRQVDQDQDIDQRDRNLPENVPGSSIKSVKSWVIGSRSWMNKRDKKSEEKIRNKPNKSGNGSKNCFKKNRTDQENPTKKVKKRKTDKDPTEKTKPSKKKKLEEKLNSFTDWREAPSNLQEVGKADSENHWYVEEVLAVRQKDANRQKGKKRCYLVKWLNWPKKYNSWEPEENFYPRIKGEAFDQFITSREESAKEKNKWLGDELHQLQSPELSIWDKN